MAIRRIKVAWQMVSGLVTLVDVLGFIGFWLFRGTLRRTLAVAIALGAVFFIGAQSRSDYALTLDQALHGAGLIFIISCFGGGLLMLVSGSFSRSAMSIGEAKGFNLLEDMKQARAPLHREKLWRRVYRWEQTMVSADDRRVELHTIAEHRDELADAADPSRRAAMSESDRRRVDEMVKRLGTTEQGWRMMFDYAAQTPQSLASLSHRLRFNLNKVKDWYDGAPFHATDWKLATQFDASDTLRRAKRDAGLNRWAAVMHVRVRYVQQLWFRMITRAVQVRVASACGKLDRKYAPYTFSVDHFLWPSADLDAVIADRLGPAALAELAERRRHIFRTVFHHDVTLAHQLMRKAIYPNFAAATELRRRYDPQYVCGELEYEWADDVERYDKAFRQSKRAVFRRERARRIARLRQQGLAVYLAEHPEFDPVGDAEFRRAIRVAYHVNRYGLRELVEAGRDPHERVEPEGLARLRERVARWWASSKSSPAPPPRPRSIADIIAHVAAEVEQYTHKLLTVRLHHELTRLELEDYAFYLDRIMR